MKQLEIGDMSGSNEGGEVKLSDHDLHILTERERRKKMRNMFHLLHDLLPHLPPKTDKSTIVAEAATYIKTLEQTLQKLERKKLERLQYGLSSTNTTITSTSRIQPQKLVYNSTRESFLADHGSSTGHFEMVSPSSSTSLSFSNRSPSIFKKWASSSVTLNMCGLDAHISICSSPKPGLLTAICLVLEKHKLETVLAEISSDQTKNLVMIHARANASDQFVERFGCDEIYKQAATEITNWVNSKSS